MKEGLLYERTEDQSVVCNLCAHRCLIRPGRIGICGVRENKAGVLYTLVYDRVVAAHPDPIEKKPLFHFLPRTSSFSIATVGCNFHCLFCQNWDISQTPKDRHGLILGKKLSPEQIVRKALQNRCATIAYTYTEPTIFFELAYDTAKLAVARGLKNIFVTNGYLTPEALTMMQPYLQRPKLWRRYPMSTMGSEISDTTLQKTHLWLNEIMTEVEGSAREYRVDCYWPRRKRALVNVTERAQ
jgi:pyruvate formate lyase activating enzyme